MNPIPFWKCQAIGNDFVIVHGDSVRGHDLPQLAQTVCRRRYGVGADGLLVIEPGVRLRMFNPDGSEDFCGNGLRCATVHAFHQGWIGLTGRVKHFGRSVEVWTDGGTRARVVLPGASFLPADIPIRQVTECFGQLYGNHTIYSVSTGSAHTIILVDELPGDEEFFNTSQRLENDELFPERTSVMWVKILGENHLKMRIWERGAGETLGCGTGSAAAAVVYCRKFNKKGEINVENPGGSVIVGISSIKGPISLESETEQLFHGDLLVTEESLSLLPGGLA